MEKTLVFFNNMPTLVDAYTYVREAIGQSVGDPNPLISMYMSITSSERKAAVMEDLNNPKGSSRVVFCTSSLAVVVNMRDVKYVIHYGSPRLVQDFLQETGRVAQESSAHGHSILVRFPRMNAKGLSDTMKAYVKGEECRRLTILKVFGSKSTQTKAPSCCDICNPNITYSFKSVVDAYYTDQAADDQLSDSSSGSEPSIGGIEYNDTDSD